MVMLFDEFVDDTKKELGIDNKKLTNKRFARIKRFFEHNKKEIELKYSSIPQRKVSGHGIKPLINSEMKQTKGE